jgi:hypothetical protein
MPHAAKQVRILSLREIAEMWAPELGISETAVLRELRIAEVNLPRWRDGLPLSQPEEWPSEEELPNPDEWKDREWLIEFCAKQKWSAPKFWSDEGYEAPGRYAGRPTNLARPMITEEFLRRAQAGELAETLAAEARHLRDWSEGQFPHINPPSPRTLENAYRDQFREFKKTPQN